MRSYKAARDLFSILAFCAWGVVGLGVIIGLLGALATQGLGSSSGGLQSILGALPGLMISLGGLFSLAMVQMGRASVDTAEYSQQSLAVSRQQLELSRQLLEQSKTTTVSYAQTQPAKSIPASSGASTSSGAGASYADRSQNASAVPVVDGDQLPAPDHSGSSPAALEKQGQVLLEPAREEITFKDGRFYVGNKPFWSEDDATAYQESLVAIPATSTEK